MPKVRHWVCQKFAILGPAGFQDVIWKCFQCQKKYDTPLFCFHFLFILVFFSPGIFYSLHVASLRRSLQHVEAPLPREGSAFAAVFAASCLIPWPFFPSCLLVHSQSSLCLFVWPWDGALPLLSASCARGSIMPFQDEDAGHSMSWVVLFCVIL